MRHLFLLLTFFSYSLLGWESQCPEGCGGEDDPNVKKMGELIFDGLADVKSKSESKCYSSELLIIWKSSSSYKDILHPHETEWLLGWDGNVLDLFLSCYCPKTKPNEKVDSKKVEVDDYDDEDDDDYYYDDEEFGCENRFPSGDNYSTTDNFSRFYFLYSPPTTFPSVLRR